VAEVTAPIVAAIRKKIPTFGGEIDVTIIEGGDAVPVIYVDHGRDWIEIGDFRFIGNRAEFTAWLRAAADLIDQAEAPNAGAS
jgi:hypothetical protein